MNELVVLRLVSILRRQMAMLDQIAHVLELDCFKLRRGISENPSNNLQDAWAGEEG